MPTYITQNINDLTKKVTNFYKVEWQGAIIDGCKNETKANLPGSKELAISIEGRSFFATFLASFSKIFRRHDIDKKITPSLRAYDTEASTIEQTQEGTEDSDI